MEARKRLRRLTAYAGRYRYLTYASLVLSAASALLSAVPYYYIWKILDEIIGSMPDYSKADGVVGYGIAALAFTAASVLVYICALMCSHLSAFRIAKNMRKDMLGRILSLPPGALDAAGTGKIRRTVFDSAAATETYMAHQLPDRAGACVLPVAFAVLLFLFDWRLGLVSVLVVIMAAAAMLSMAGGKALRKSLESYQTALAGMNREAVEYVRGMSVVKTFQQTVDSFREFKASIDGFGKWAVKYTMWCRKRMTAFVVISSSAISLLIITALALNGGTDWSSGFLSDFIFYVVFTPIISLLLLRIMYSSREGMIVDDALARVDELLAQEPLPEPESPKAPENMTVRFEGVTFTYPGSETPALSGVDMEIRQGAVTALVGPSGSGKSTAAALACRFWDPQEGRVTIGGIDVRDIGSAKMGEMVSFVFQRSGLLKDTLLNNVRAARPSATEEEVAEALRRAQCSDIVAKLPEGLGTMLGPGGAHLSGGEVQRLAIARAFLKDAPIVILDEATAFADPENEYLVQRAFEELSADRTVLMIAHRLTTVRRADRIYVMDGGRISEYGTHDEMASGNGRYSRMWKEYTESVDWKIGGTPQ